MLSIVGSTDSVFRGGRISRAVIAKLRHLAEQEDGFVSMLNLMAMLGILLGITAVANIALVTRDKLESQNAADGVVQASITQMARGMNAVTATNHSIGEIQAIVVLHHAWGGDELERGSGDITPGGLRNNLQTVFQLAWGISPSSYRPDLPQYRDLSARVKSGAALGDAFLQLKKLTVPTYGIHATGGALYWWWKTRPLGIALMNFAKSFIKTLHREWKILNAAETVAKSSLMRNKQRLRDHYLPSLYRYSLKQQNITPDRMEDAARETGEHHFVEGSLFPGRKTNPSRPPLRLPVEPEPRQISSDRIWCSQLVRSSTPWIQYWRQPVLLQSQVTLPLSRFAHYYHRHTQEMSLSLAERAKQGQGIHLLVIDDHTILSGNKGQEPWTRSRGSRRADELFSVIGFTQREPPPIIGQGVYVKGVDQRLVTFAQGMIYNANPVEIAGAGGRNWQVETGWDTLNWIHGKIPEWHFGASFRAAVSFREHPRIQLNWQGMLVPSTRIDDAGQWQRGALGGVLEATETGLTRARTH